MYLHDEKIEPNELYILASQPPPCNYWPKGKCRLISRENESSAGQDGVGELILANGAR
jgi:hypothetical protein